MEKISYTLTENQSFLWNGSCVFFFKPFLPLDKRLFLGRASVETGLKIVEEIVFRGAIGK
jgi:hypothetical protein